MAKSFWKLSIVITGSGYSHILPFFWNIGKYPINTLDSFVSISEYDTKDVRDCFIECHQKFIDIQIITKGEEKIGIVPKQYCKGGSYDKEKDFEKLEGTTQFIDLKPGSFMIFFPQDGHMPCVKTGEKTCAIKKAVFKIKVL